MLQTVRNPPPLDDQLALPSPRTFETPLAQHSRTVPPPVRVTQPRFLPGGCARNPPRRLSPQLSRVAAPEARGIVPSSCILNSDRISLQTFPSVPDKAKSQDN